MHQHSTFGGKGSKRVSLQAMHGALEQMRQPRVAALPVLFCAAFYDKTVVLYTLSHMWRL